jgi:hypothetical protein
MDNNDPPIVSLIGNNGYIRQKYFAVSLFAQRFKVGFFGSLLARLFIFTMGND